MTCKYNSVSVSVNRITRVTRTITSSVPVMGEDIEESENLHESVKKIVDQFMAEERKGQ
jgi:hypothetical protein